METLRKICLGLGALCIIATAVLAITYMGFYDANMPKTGPKVILIPDQKTLWLVVLSLGALGGFLINFTRPVASIPSGMVAAAAITLISLIYVSFRKSILNLEILVPLFLGVTPGFMLYGFIMKRYYKENPPDGKEDKQT